MAEELGYNLENYAGPKKLEIQAKIQTDYTRLDVFYQTLNVKAITQSPSIAVDLVYLKKIQ